MAMSILYFKTSERTQINNPIMTTILKKTKKK